MKNLDQKTKYEKMFPHEFEFALENNPTAYLPIGSLEWHGYHNVLGLDSLKAWKILELVAQKNGGIVFPPMYLGLDTYPDLDLEKYPNKKYDCYHLEKEVLGKVVKACFQNMIKIGFKKIFVLAGHYPNYGVAKTVAEKLGDQNAKIIVNREFDFAKDENGDHAGKWETSLMMVLFPDLVNLENMKNKEDNLLAVNGEDPRLATKEYGEKMLSEITKGIIKKLK